ncbi:MAG: hypothetical protein P4L68_05105 [Methylovirgula sp.]|nr:hypothetical protein [Methylovirgula sp.]
MRKGVMARRDDTPLTFRRKRERSGDESVTGLNQRFVPGKILRLARREPQFFAK